MAIIVYDIDCKEKTIEFFNTAVNALKHKADLENAGCEVAYIDIPNISVAMAEAVYQATQ